MKSKVFRLLTTFLLLVLLVGSLSVTAFATGDDPSGDSEISGPEHKDNVLAPDGNMTIVDDIHGDADKQFITVKSEEMRAALEQADDSEMEDDTDEI